MTYGLSRRDDRNLFSPRIIRYQRIIFRFCGEEFVDTIFKQDQEIMFDVVSLLSAIWRHLAACEGAVLQGFVIRKQTNTQDYNNLVHTAIVYLKWPAYSNSKPISVKNKLYNKH